MTPHRGPSRQGIAATGRWPLPPAPVGGIPATPCGSRRAAAGRASPVADSLRPTAPAWWPPAHVVRSPPARAPLMVRPRGVVAPLPLGPPATSPAAAPGCDPKADARVVGAGAPLHPGATHLAGRHPGRPADLPPRLAARHPPTILRHPRHAARAMPARVRQAVPARGSRPATEGRQGWNHRWHHWNQGNNNRLQSKASQRPHPPTASQIRRAARPTPLASGRPLGIIR